MRYRVMLSAVVVGPLFSMLPAHSQTSARPRTPPKLTPVAETKLLMEGMAQPNYRALEKLLTETPADNEAWVFARGQALLLAETGNLLMIRPPNNAGQDQWMEYAASFRETASRLARACGTRDEAGARRGLSELAGACNRCHQTFRVPVRVGSGSSARPIRP
jgi:hypothetical protein